MANPVPLFPKPEQFWRVFGCLYEPCPGCAWCRDLDETERAATAARNQEEETA